MKIMIMSCSNPTFWYKSSIGKTFNVVRQDSKKYYVKNQKVLVPVVKDDSEVIEK